MIVEPKIRHNICINAHPAGCAAQVREQIEYVRNMGPIRGTERALIIGSSGGYGLAARIVASFGCGASTVGVAFEKQGTASRTGTAGWYNDRAFTDEARRDGLGAWSVNGDAFSKAVKEETVDLVRGELGGVDLVVYSIASPRRMDPDTGALYATAIKPIERPFTEKTVDFLTGEVTDVSAEPASAEEIFNTVKVMGGEDWELWIEALIEAGLAGRGFTTVAFSYVGPALTAPIYRQGTIGKAKEHLEATAAKLHARLREQGGRALISINKALVTRASAVIPAVPLYIALLYRVMKAKGLHEGCIEQMVRLFKDYLYGDSPLPFDSEGRVRLDDREMRDDVQKKVEALWKEVNSRNLSTLADMEGFRTEFLRHHGFAMDGVDYSAEVTV